ncbi:MAG TPA: nucleotide sugar dehydrogenase [Thermoanaerobaculia bacterium]|jgi:UDP-N-acetyl-D-mannosaminuronic acid dehydrogenase|nr:nucleotide sugar dehydrogenase [Thermoanaerobaculia bacterium]
MAESPFSHDICVIGGAGHVGLPFALICADSGLRTVIYDKDCQKVRQIRSGEMPFAEEGADEVLRRVLPTGRLAVEDQADLMSQCRFLVMIIGTPLDEHLNPSFVAIDRVLESAREHLRDGQILILRSTVFPGTSQRIQRYLSGSGLNIQVACCPERVAEGYSLREFRQLPQIISAFEADTLDAVRGLFARFTPEFVEMEPMEAELCKLMTNSWRYIQFATVNQFFMLASGCGVDFDRILHGCRHNYPRMAGMPGPGFAAGPCLVKDTMQLAAFSQNHFMLGHSAMLVNEGLPSHLIGLAKTRMDLGQMTAGILGMAFKAESDDPRDSLSYKLRKLLMLEARAVLCTDPYVRDSSLVPLERVLADADVLFVATPHQCYRRLPPIEGKAVIDIWSCLQSPA